MSSCAPRASVRRVLSDAGRACPADYRLSPSAFSGEPAHVCDVLYVVGGLYGNPFALDAVEALVEHEDGNTLVVLNGDVHWFDKTAENFEYIENRIKPHMALVGNVEAELRRQVDVGVGCGCAYPDCTPDDAVSRSNRIHRMLSEVVEGHPPFKTMLEGRPSTATVSVAGKKIAITHGDEHLLGGWACSRESLVDVLRQDELDCWMESNQIDVLATTHTCAPAALALARGVVVNNGSAGLPNFENQSFGLVVRVATTPHPDALFEIERDGLFVQAVCLRYDHAAYVAWFDALWPSTSPAAVSYRQRIVSGPDDRLQDALLGGFHPGPAAKITRSVKKKPRATKEEVREKLAQLVYFEDMLPDSEYARTVQEPSTIQVNVTARCNLACAHCHVESGPHRREAMTKEVLQAVLEVAARPQITTIDITGGAPEMNPDFAWFIEQASKVAHVMVRTNLVILQDPAYRFLLDCYAEQRVEIVASLPNVFAAQAEQQRGSATFDASLSVLRELTTRGYGCDGRHTLDLVFNPQWPVLPPTEAELDELYRRRLGALGIRFDKLFSVANNPIGRYGAHLIDTDVFDDYMALLLDNFNKEACVSMMCRHQLSVGWDGRIYDCDFNQALGLAQSQQGREVTIFDYANNPSCSLARDIHFRNHCFTCTAGHGSSCGGTLVKE